MELWLGTSVYQMFLPLWRRIKEKGCDRMKAREIKKKMLEDYRVAIERYKYAKKDVDVKYEAIIKNEENLFKYFGIKECYETKDNTSTCPF